GRPGARKAAGRRGGDGRLRPHRYPRGRARRASSGAEARADGRHGTVAARRPGRARRRPPRARGELPLLRGRARAGDDALDGGRGHRGRAPRAGAPACAHPRLAALLRPGACGGGARLLPRDGRPARLRPDRGGVPGTRRAAARQGRGAASTWRIGHRTHRSPYHRAVMSAMVQLATAGDVAEAEEMQEILRKAGIDSSLEQSAEEDAVNVLVPEADRETAQEAIEALTEPDDLISEPQTAADAHDAG